MRCEHAVLIQRCTLLQAPCRCEWTRQIWGMTLAWSSMAMHKGTPRLCAPSSRAPVRRWWCVPPPWLMLQAVSACSCILELWLSAADKEGLRLPAGIGRTA